MNVFFVTNKYGFQSLYQRKIRVTRDMDDCDLMLFTSFFGSFQFLEQKVFYELGLLAPRPTPNLPLFLWPLL